VAQVGEHLICKGKALSSNPVPPKKEKKHRCIQKGLEPWANRGKQRKKGCRSWEEKQDIQNNI
jgi:hypothetical protein